MSDYEISDDENDYYDSDEVMEDGTQDDAYESENDMDMDAFNDDFKVATGSKRKPYDIEYESLSQVAVEKLMQADVDHICGILGVEPPWAVLLLRRLNWNKEKLIEKYMDNASAMLLDAGITLPEPPSEPTPIRTHSSSSQVNASSATRRSSRMTSKLSSLVSSGKGSKSHPPPSAPTRKNSSPVASANSSAKASAESFTCPICFDDSPELLPISLDCEHVFCSGCWSAYLTSKIMDEQEHQLQCMAERCTLICPDQFVISLLISDEHTSSLLQSEKEERKRVAARFHELTIRNFVGSNPNLKYCPYPGCTNTVSCPSAASNFTLLELVPTVSCGARGIISADGKEQQSSQSQGSQRTNSSSSANPLSLAGKEHKFCFGCPIEGDHRPLICSVAKMWLKKCRDDSETANWIKGNTKECPQCQSTIEKNGGCNHMTCKKCKHEFCWVCMGPWSEHGTQWYTCNRYDEKAGVDARDAQSKSRASLERYLHYYNRWANHEQSAKLALDLYAKTEKKMEDMQITSSLTWIEVQFMKKAVEEVDKCRMTLKWTYAMAYYLAKSNQKDLFEDNQRDLEKAVEDLSELLESPLEPELIGTLRQKVTDKTVYVTKRNEIVLDDTANGFLEGRWRWNVHVEGFDDEPDNFLN